MKPCECECHDGESFETPERWKVTTLTADFDMATAKFERLCTDCLLTLISARDDLVIALARAR